VPKNSASIAPGNPARILTSDVGDVSTVVAVNAFPQLMSGWFGRRAPMVDGDSVEAIERG
jgi:hypothetical protein